MIIVYDAANSLDANMIKGLLEQYEIRAFIQGEYLQGGMGELPAADLVKVSVDDKNFTEAKHIIAEWEAATILEEDKSTILLGGALNVSS